MDETKILETFRFDFTYRYRDAERLNALFAKHGYPNLVVDLSNDYDGYWSVVNTRKRETIWNDYHTGFVTFYVENEIVKICFDHKANQNKMLEDGSMKTLKKFEGYTHVYFEPVRKITQPTDKEEEISKLKKEIYSLKEELEIYQNKEKKILELLKS